MPTSCRRGNDERSDHRRVSGRGGVKKAEYGHLDDEYYPNEGAGGRGPEKDEGIEGTGRGKWREEKKWGVVLSAGEA